MEGAPVNAKTANKIKILESLVEQGATAGERDAAERMLARYRAKAETEAAEYVWTPNWAGAKYDRGQSLSTVEIAALIRADIKMAIKVAKAASAPGAVAVYDAFAVLPAGIKIGVKVPHYGAITITVKNIPGEWGFEMGEYYPGEPQKMPTRALCDLGCELAEIGNAYNYDNSDTQSDHFDRRYYLNVYAENGVGSIDHDYYQFARRRHDPIALAACAERDAAMYAEYAAQAALEAAPAEIPAAGPDATAEATEAAGRPKVSREASGASVRLVQESLFPVPDACGTGDLLDELAQEAALVAGPVRRLACPGAVRPVSSRLSRKVYRHHVDRLA
jgi:hypothetical protein